MGVQRYQNGSTVALQPGALEIPLRWRRPRRIFVNSMSDLFHGHVPKDYIDQVFGVMERAHWHQFQVLTKRPGRMAAYLTGFGGGTDGLVRGSAYTGRVLPPNVWLG